MSLLPRVLGLITAVYSLAIGLRPVLLARPCGLAEGPDQRRVSPAVATLIGGIGARGAALGAAVGLPPTRPPPRPGVAARGAAGPRGARVFRPEPAPPGPRRRRVLRLEAARPGPAGAHRPVRGRLGHAVRAERTLGGVNAAEPALSRWGCGGSRRRPADPARRPRRPPRGPRTTWPTASA